MTDDHDAHRSRPETQESYGIPESHEEGTDEELLGALDSAYEEKYGTPHGTPFWMIRPRVVFAWSDYPTDATRWEFE